MILTSKRLSLSPASEQDAEALHVLWSDDEFMRNIWRESSLPLAMTLDAIHASRLLFERQGQGIWKACMPGADRPIAFIALGCLGGTTEADLTFAVAASHAGDGVASEMVSTICTYAHRNLALFELRARAPAGNGAAARVLEKCGFAARARAPGANCIAFTRILRERTPTHAMLGLA